MISAQFIFLAILLTFAPNLSSASKLRDDNASCTASCDQKYPTGTPLVLCGTDLTTHKTTYDAAIDEDCYSDICNVNTYYAGPCGCPNNCYSEFQRGQCGGDGVCSCANGWRGKDCSQPAVNNNCNLHGHIISPGSKDSVFPFDYCQCQDGWTGPDCAVPVLASSVLPYGEVFEDTPVEYTSDDKYNDDHPVFNTTLIATIRITLPEASLLPLLEPINLYNQSYASADISFDNGFVQETVKNIGFRLKGDLCRRSQKKCWVLKFNEFVDGQHFKGLKKLGLKGGTNDDDVLSKYMIYVDMLRTMNVPMQRTSYTLLYLNDVCMGLYLMHEYIDDDFLRGHIGRDDGTGNLMKLDGGVFLQYAGSDVSVYMNDDRYEQAQGNGDWTDFVDWLQFLDGQATNDETFFENLEKRVHVNEVLRLMVVESFLMNTDGMARNGHNYNAYHLHSNKNNNKNSNKEKKYLKSNKNNNDGDGDDDNYYNPNQDPEKWILLNYDFDRTFEYKRDTNTPFVGESMSDILGFYLRDINTSSSYNPLFNRLLGSTKYKNQYLDLYRQFLEHVFQLDFARTKNNHTKDTTHSNNTNTNNVKKANSSDTKRVVSSSGKKASIQPAVLQSQRMQFVLPYIAQDYMWQLSNDMTIGDYVFYSERTIANLSGRVQNVTRMIDQYAQP